MIIDNEDDVNTNEDNNDFCQQTSNYATLTEIGHYPAIYYFGQSFQSTLLTTFFTLFAIIGENDIPVSI